MLCQDNNPQIKQDPVSAGFVDPIPTQLCMSFYRKRMATWGDIAHCSWPFHFRVQICLHQAVGNGWDWTKINWYPCTIICMEFYFTLYSSTSSRCLSTYTLRTSLSHTQHAAAQLKAECSVHSACRPQPDLRLIHFFTYLLTGNKKQNY